MRGEEALFFLLPKAKGGGWSWLGIFSPTKDGVEERLAYGVRGARGYVVVLWVGED